MPSTYIHDGSAHRKVSQWYAHDGAAWRKLREAWCHDGSAWRKVFSGASRGMFSVSAIGKIYDLVTYQTGGVFHLYAGTSTGLWKYDGSSWQQLHSTMTNSLAVSLDGGLLYAAVAQAHVYVWNGSALTQMTDPVIDRTYTVSCGLFVGSLGLIVSHDNLDSVAWRVQFWNGSAWVKLGDYPYAYYRTARPVETDALYAWDSPNLFTLWNGSAWVPMTTAPQTITCSAGAIGSSKAYFGTAGALRSYSGGAWGVETTGIAKIRDMVLHNGVLFIASDDGVYTWDGATILVIDTIGATKIEHDPAAGVVYALRGSDIYWWQT